jgi:hypothetical protein
MGVAHDRHRQLRQETFMSNANPDVAIDQLGSVTGGFGVPSWLKTAGEFVAPALLANPVTAPAGLALANKKALAHGAVWGGGGAVAGSAGFLAGPEVGIPTVAAGAAGGFLSGYYDSVLTQHGGGKY